MNNFALRYEHLKIRCSLNLDSIAFQRYMRNKEAGRLLRPAFFMPVRVSKINTKGYKKIFCTFLMTSLVLIFFFIKFVQLN